MPDHKIKCEVVEIDNAATCHKVGDSFTLWKRTPAGMCCRAFTAIYPSALAMRFSERMAWEMPEGHIDVMCPDHNVVYRLSRVKDDTSAEQAARRDA